jgi:RNase P/RNase MRP subunit p29
MSNRSETATAAAAGKRACRPDLRVWAFALMLISWIAWAGDLRADDIVLKSGESIEGSIIDATRNTVIVRRAIGGMRQMPIQDIEEVRIDLVQGAPIAGQILSWVDGVYQVRAGGEVVRIEAGRILSRERAQEVRREVPRVPTARIEAPAVEAAAPKAAAAEEATARAVDGETPAEETDAERAATEPAVGESAAERTAAGDTTAESAAAERAAAETTAGKTAAERTAAEDTAPESAAAESPAESAAAETTAGTRAAEQTAPEDTAPESAAESPARESAAAPVVAAPKRGSDRQPVAIRASVDPAAAGAAGMVFKIELSRPAEQTVVLIYGTVDGTAKAGQDYEAQQGVVTLAPGTRSAEVNVPLIEHQPPRGDTRFELFLAADPKVAELVDPRITATIPGKD